MKNLLFTTLVVLVFWACGNEPKITESVKKDDTTANQSRATAPDSLVIDVDSTGHIQIGSHEANLDNLGQILVDSLKSIKTATGQLPDTIVLHKKGDVMMGTRHEIRSIIEESKTAIGY